MTLEERISEWMDAHEAELVRDISRLVAIPSVKGEAAPGAPFGVECRRALDEMTALCGEYGFATAIYGGAAGSADYNEKPAALDILGHLDVVGAGEGWDTEPYAATLGADGCLYGRGVDDDKGSVIMALYGMRCLKELGLELAGGCRLIYGTDEESGSADLPYYYASNAPAPNTFTPDTGFPVFNTEKGRYCVKITRGHAADADAGARIISASGGFRANVVPGDAGALLAGITAGEVLALASGRAAALGVELSAADTPEGCRVAVHGRQAHAAEPWTGYNAVTALLELLAALPLGGAAHEDAAALSRFFPHGGWLGEALGIAQEDEVSGPLTISANVLSIDASGCTLECDARVPLCANEENCRGRLAAALAEAGFTAVGEMSPGHHTPGDGEFVRTLLACYEHYTGLPGECVATGGGTYVHDIPGGVGFGAYLPGFDTRLHGANERIRVSDALTAGKIFALAIARICKIKEDN